MQTNKRGPYLRDVERSWPRLTRVDFGGSTSVAGSECGKGVPQAIHPRLILQKCGHVLHKRSYRLYVYTVCAFLIYPILFLKALIKNISIKMKTGLFIGKS